MADLRLLALTHLIAAAAGFAIAPRELLETEVTHNGFFETDTKRVLTAEDAAFDEGSRVVTINLPPLVMGDVAFEPEGARTTNGGLLTYSQSEVEELSKLNYASARKAFVKQAQSRPVVDAAEQQAKANVRSALELPLRIVGRPNIEVVARFRSSG